MSTLWHGGKGGEGAAGGAGGEGPVATPPPHAQQRFSTVESIHWYVAQSHDWLYGPVGLAAEGSGERGAE